jgi:hypothetical protein
VEGGFVEDPDELGGIYPLLVIIVTMLMEDDGLNLLMLESVGVYQWIKKLLTYHVTETKKDKWSAGWPQDNDIVTAAMWIMWLTTTEGVSLCSSPRAVLILSRRKYCHRDRG